jgi:hypothetical protein
MFPAQIPSAQVARHGDIRCRICPEIEDEFPANPANFSSSRCLENCGANCCGALSAIAVRHVSAVSSLESLRADSDARATSAWEPEEKCGQAPRRPKMESGLHGARPQSVASRRYEGLPIRASGGTPAEAGKHHQIALRFIPDRALAPIFAAEVARYTCFTFASFVSRFA